MPATATQRHFAAHISRPQTDAQRKRDLGHIHQGKKALNWTDDDYRFHLVNLTGKDSAANLGSGERAKVLALMATAGFKPKATTFKPFDQAAKIKWLWKKIGEAGGVRDASPAALLAFIGRHTGKGVADVKFLSTQDASSVIEALKAILTRAERSQKGPQEQEFRPVAKLT